ncbi:MAG TPA: TonB-dependent receptor [Longimicrobiaceae bacterium]
MRKALFACLAALLWLAPGAWAQATGTISGTITNDAGEPLAAVNVAVSGYEALSGQTGRYTIAAIPAGVYTLRASLLGYSEYTEEVTVTAGQVTTVNIVLSAQAVELEGVVAVGYGGTQREESVTGSIASVSGADLVRTPAVTTSGTLVGKVPGVLTRQADSRPGSSTSIQIRNLGTPLFVIDGIPKDEGQFNNIDPHDIASITILKDASAAAVYGVRAANGVVLVTTKRGLRNQSSRVDVHTYYGWQNWGRFPKPADAGTWVRARAEAEINQFGETSWTPEEVALWQEGTQPGYRSFDWYDFAVQKNAPQHYLSVSSTGGSDRINYYLSASRVDQEAVFNEYVFNRTNLQANVDAQISERLSVGAQINGRIETRKNPGNPGFDDYWQPIFGIYRNKPTERAYANDNPLYPNHIENIASNYATLNYDISGYWESIWRVQQTNLSATYDLPIDGLAATARYSYYLADNVENTFEYTYDVFTYYPETDEYVRTGGNDNPFRDRWSRKVEENMLQLQLNYDKRFGRHGVSFDAAFEANERLEPRYWLRSQPSTNYIELINLNELKELRDEQSESARMGYVLRANYDYDDRYLFEVAGRYDASWQFAPGKRWGLFPSASAGWRISDEPFYLNSRLSSILPELKLRASYGVLGDDRVGIGPFDYLEGYNYDRGNAVLDGQLITGIEPRGLPIDNISWLRSTMTNVGLDFGLLDGRLGGTLEYFYRKRTGLPARRWDVLIPQEVAIDLPNENLNADAHVGVEASLSFSDQLSNGLSYSLGGNVTFARQRDLYTYKPRFGNSWDRYRNSIEDRWAFINWGYEVIGQFESEEQIANYPVDIDGQNNTTLLPGDFIYKDANGDGIISSLDERPIGFRMGALPYLSFGLNASTAWKGFDLNLLFSGAGYQSYERNWEMKIPFQNDANSPEFMLTDRWHREDIWDPNSRWIPGKYPALRKEWETHSNMRKSDWWVTNVNYLRLRTVELGYTLPQSVIDSFRIRSARIYVTGSNLFSLDNVGEFGIDPEVASANGLQYPPLRMINVGANVGL